MLLLVFVFFAIFLSVMIFGCPGSSVFEKVDFRSFLDKLSIIKGKNNMYSDDLFSNAYQTKSYAPLADILRPKNFDDFFGSNKLTEIFK